MHSTPELRSTRSAWPKRQGGILGTVSCRLGGQLREGSTRPTISRVAHLVFCPDANPGRRSAQQRDADVAPDPEPIASLQVHRAAVSPAAGRIVHCATGPRVGILR